MIDQIIRQGESGNITGICISRLKYACIIICFQAHKGY